MRNYTLLNDGTAELYESGLPPPVSLQITPGTTNFLTGANQVFTAVDDQGQTRLDAVWSVSDPNVLSLPSNASGQITAANPGQATLTANVDGVIANLQITVAPHSLQITPGAATLLVGDSRQFTVVDERGKPSPIATWSVDNQGLASVTTDPSTTLTALAAGTVNLSATVEGVSTQIPVTISGATSFAPGTVLWSAPSAPGYTPQGLFQAVPNGHWPKSLFRSGRHRCYPNTCASLYFRWPAALANLAEFRLCGPLRPRWLWRHDRVNRLRRPQLHPAHPQRRQSPGRFQLVGANNFLHLHGRLRQRHLLRLPHAVSNLVRRGFATAPRGGETRSRLVYNPRHRSPGVRPSPAKYSFSSRRGRSWHALGFKFSCMSKLLGPGD